MTRCSRRVSQNFHDNCAVCEKKHPRPLVWNKRANRNCKFVVLKIHFQSCPSNGRKKKRVFLSSSILQTIQTPSPTYLIHSFSPFTASQFLFILFARPTGHRRLEKTREREREREELIFWSKSSVARLLFTIGNRRL